MKKIIAMLMVIAMLLSLVACGSSEAASAAPAESAASAASEAAPAAESDLDYVLGKGTLVVGITEFAPMDYKNEAGEWIGFDADMARLVAEELGVEIEFVVIDWDMKINEVNAKNIDCVWNGMTLTNEVTSAMDCSAAYCNNAQVVVTK